MESVDDLLYRAWAIIANVDLGTWTEQSEEWHAAVLSWRQDFHEHLARSLDA